MLNSSLVRLALSVLIFANSGLSKADDISRGRWIVGDLHVHTALSADAHTPLRNAVNKGFDDFGLDYMAISNHLRNNSRDNWGDESISQLFSQSLAQFEWPAQLQLIKNHQDKLLLSTFEWDVPTHDHMNVGILTNGVTNDKLAATTYFEYRFGMKNDVDDFTDAQRVAFNQAGVKRQNKTHKDGLAALSWLQQHHTGNSYVMLNHPTRYATSYSIDDVRQFNDIAPDVFFLVEGMVGNQFNGYRGDYDDKSRRGLLGGSDPFTAEVGGNWDTLLSEGRRIWLVANSDHHFKAIAPYASGYFPGEYAKTYVFLEDEPLNQSNWLSAMRSGNSFSVFGDIINRLTFMLNDSSASATMGRVLKAEQGESITVTIQVTQPTYSNREAVVGDNNYRGNIPALDHIDLIMGEMTPKPAQSPHANKPTRNLSTKVIHTFNAKDWTINSDGVYTMSFNLSADANSYFRLRGTSLSKNEKGFTKEGEPMRSKVIQRDGKSTPDYYKAINKRNYIDTWFYSNPIYLMIKKSED